jgi:molecular chaperone DnaJ
VSGQEPEPKQADQRRRTPHVSYNCDRAKLGAVRLEVFEDGRIPGMASAAKADYYEVLGVERDADEEAIRRAFHALARECHPDVSHAPDAEKRFRDLAEAYSVLSKHESRLLYDRYGYRGQGNRGFNETLWDTRPRAERGENVHTAIKLKSFEADQGTRRLVRYEADARCNGCMGRGIVGEPDPGCKVCGGSGVTSAERRIRLLIPPGVVDGAQLRVGGDGHYAGLGSIPGDLLVDVRVLPEPRDPRVVRYVAFMLLMVSMTALVVYVVSH